MYYYMVRFSDGSFLGAYRGHGVQQKDPKLYRTKGVADLMAKRLDGVTVKVSLNIILGE